VTNEEYLDKIRDDLVQRQLFIGGVIACDAITGKLRFITYDEKGLVDSISSPENTISLYSKENAETRAMHEITTLTGVKNKSKSVPGTSNIMEAAK